MNAWETDDEYAAAAQRPLPTPVDTPSRNSSRHSRRSRRKKSVSPVHASSPGPIPHAEMHNRRESRDVTTDENISILDPRRFTPTLHANLVAEILNLRRDQEEKIRAIEGLEETLHASKGEVEELSSSLSTNAKENRSLKRQLALLEGGTSNALGELARERDEAVESISDIKKRLDASQKKVRAQEVDSDRVHGLWAQDKDTWDDERRKLERKVHVAEGRLKTVLDEVAAYQASHPMQESEAEELGGHGSDTASVRSMSMTNSVRFSMLPSGSKLNGMSLADELDFGDDDELSQMYQDGRESVLSNTHGRESVLSTTHGRESVLSTTHRRNLSRDSMISRNHKHSQSIESVRRPGSVARGRLLANQSVLEKLEGRIAEGDETLVLSKPDYVDSSTQYSPPISSASNPAVLPEPAADPQLRQVDNVQGGETEANQRRKRVRASTPVPQVAPSAVDTMVSSACQTVDEPLSPPRTPTTPTAVSEVEKECMISISTQTEGEWALVVKAPPVPPTIPSISIHPPTSRPATPKESLLPQYFKDVACQVSMQVAAPYSSASVQTEEIRVDKRLNLLPLHLQPSSISSCPPSPEPSAQPAGFFTPGVVPPPRNPRRKKSNQSIGEPPSSPPVPMRSPPAPPMSAETHDSYPGNNDDGPISMDKGIRRPPRISSLFAGFENVSSDDADDFADGDLSDSDFRTALSAPRPRKSLNRGKRNSTAPTSVPEDEEPVEEAVSNHVKKQARQAQGGYDANGEVILRDNLNTYGAKSAVTRTIRQFDKPLSLVMPPARPPQTTMRRAALISNGIAAHQGRSRSPSLPDAVKEPPFPIPTRASSRKPPFSASAPSDGSRSPTREPWSRRSSGRGHHRINSIRKVRSAAALPDVGGRPRRRGSRSPPPFSPSTEAPESPQLPPMPNNEITSPFMGHRDNRSSYGYSTHRKQPSNTTANTFNTQQSAGSSVQATSVVDAIAQTMVGEWMFKYVRRRKSFGVPESGALDNDASNGVRHKRWVWLAPYERAVMWSSKQPTSGSALMGKSGRKLTIQSVLDVKDDNAAPKGVNNLFNRSILILTPARALKFTATSRERHYIWLTALSFLAHSSQAIPEVMAPHPPPIESGNFDILRQNGARLQKHPIRDSIRVAKGRTILSTQSGPTTAQSSIHRGEYSIRTDTSTRGGASTADHSVKDIGVPSGGDGFVPDAADPPIVPRFTDRALINGIGHGRKRSNTGSRIPPPLSFRGFSERGAMSTGGSSNGGGGGGGGGFGNYGHAPAGSTAGMSVGTNGSSDIYTASQRSSSVMGGNSISFSNNGLSNSNRTSIRTSDASSRPGAVVNNFFEAVGTVRMEAFISPLAFPRSDNDYPVQIDDLGMGGGGSTRSGANRRRSKERRRRSRNRDSYYGRRGGGYAANTDVEDWYGGSRTAGEEEMRGGGRDDPFRGF
ncbi:hypothetical protein VF21_00241 [Pseudogymnoascus sp. 05NY08]|nr:hypothetical protein VF21_00054 [Pseudogymnoascus sp. 05NY08]OBT80872.1 hypothetical protein VF21_00241 [Pseudogymnoascus sp. 05NY08]